MIFHSIRWRLQLWHGLILSGVLTGFGVTAYHLERSNELHRIDQELHRRLGAVIDSLRRPPGGELDRERRGPPPPGGPGDFPPPPREFRLIPGRAAWFEGESNPYYYQVWRRDGAVFASSASAPPNAVRPDRSPTGGRQSGVRMRGEIREAYEFMPPGECLLVGRSLAPEIADLHQLALWLTALGGGVLVLGLAGGAWLAARAIRPIQDISAAAVRIADGDLSHRINTADTDDELSRLAVVLNSTFARLETVFTQQARFTSDASHELRTPVSVILTQTQTTLARERSGPEYRESLESCQRAAQHMRRLIESLLALARLDAGQEAFQRSTFDLAGVAREALDMLQPLAEERNITLPHDLSVAECLGDPERVGQVLTNLLTNAILHHRPGGEVRLNTRLDGRFAIAVVDDNGPGIPAEDLPRIFERFYRVDKSRTRATGGTGLGLAICQAIAEAHGGRIEVTSEWAQGSTFTLLLPVTGPEASVAAG